MHTAQALFTFRFDGATAYVFPGDFIVCQGIGCQADALRGRARAAFDAAKARQG